MNDLRRTAVWARRGTWKKWAFPRRRKAKKNPKGGTWRRSLLSACFPHPQASAFASQATMDRRPGLFPPPESDVPSPTCGSRPSHGPCSNLLESNFERLVSAHPVTGSFESDFLAKTRQQAVKDHRLRHRRLEAPICLGANPTSNRSAEKAEASPTFGFTRFELIALPESRHRSDPKRLGFRSDPLGTVRILSRTRRLATGKSWVFCCTLFVQKRPGRTTLAVPISSHGDSQVMHKLFHTRTWEAFWGGNSK